MVTTRKYLHEYSDLVGEVGDGGHVAEAAAVLVVAEEAAAGGAAAQLQV